MIQRLPSSDNRFVSPCCSFNTDGSYECRDMDECYSNPCDPGFKCINTNGSHKCKDIDECNPDPYVKVCRAGTTCRNTPGSYSCDNIDECAPDVDPCPVGTKCKEINDYPFYDCENINECAEGSDNCDPVFETCVDTPGSYRCEDINECEIEGICDVCVLHGLHHNSCWQDVVDDAMNEANAVAGSKGGAECSHIFDLTCRNDDPGYRCCGTVLGTGVCYIVPSLEIPCDGSCQC